VSTTFLPDLLDGVLMRQNQIRREFRDFEDAIDIGQPGGAVPLALNPE
jgi:hypothetical protein